LPTIEESENSESKVSNYLKPKVLQAFQHNKRICDEMLYKVHIVEKIMEILKDHKDHRNENNKNAILILKNLRELVNKMSALISKQTQRTRFYKFVRAIIINKGLIEQNKEFDSIIQLLECFLMVDFAVRTDNNNKIIQDDIQELKKVTCDT
jgi:hypothetical protein